ncbi:hypothetical protein [Arthrobacter sp. StoSoilB5]|uniref:hypothetical protein n=1 Tax=Arthrobacter sp. StoSoilB5 TaxID=2830992 RepID=UPI001CC5B5A5|nr:hypothetical protein [Arthrobacter sp. StoSoilB5]BCW46623.1 hypothetical protein StoSoilB5_38070 [Arthrobacter sp. StoSoilB5]
MLRLKNDSPLTRFLRSPRGILGIVVGALIFAGGLIAYFESGNLGFFLVILGLAVAVPVLFEGTHAVRRSLNTARQTTQKTAEQTRAAISNIARSADSIDKRVRLNEADVAKLASTGSHSKHVVTESLQPLEQIRDWVGMTRQAEGRNISIAAASGIFESISHHLPATVVHIGSGTSTAWIANCLAHLQPRPSLAAGLVDSDEELAAFRAVSGAAQSDERSTCNLLPAGPVPAASLSGITAHSADMVVIDFGGITSGSVLTDNIPGLYFHWLRPNTPVVIVDSTAIDVRPAVQAFLEAHPRLYVKTMSKSYNRAELIGA